MSPVDHVSAALDTVLTRFGGMVRAIGARYRLPEAELEELVQEVRLRLWSALGTSERIEAASSSYLYRASVSAAIDVIRRGRQRGEREVALDGALPLDTLADDAGRPDCAAERAELAAQVERALTTIPRSREAVVRMYLAGYGSGEIAEIMGWTEAKARNLVYRGLADLRARLASAGVGRDVA